MEPDLPQPEFLTVPKAARICGVSRNTVYAWVRKGKMEAYQTPGRTNLIRPADLVVFMRDNGMFVPQALAEMAQRDARMGAPRSRPGPEGRPKGSMLIVDRDPRSRMLAVRAVPRGLGVYQATTAYEALHLLTLREDISVVLLDTEVPGYHGPETLAEMHQLRPDAAMVLVAGRDTDAPARRKPRGLMLDTVTKPFSLDALRGVLARLAKRLG